MAANDVICALLAVVMFVGRENYDRQPRRLLLYVTHELKRRIAGLILGVQSALEAAGYDAACYKPSPDAKSVDAIEVAGPENFKGKVVIDTTNPLDMSGAVPKLIGSLGDSGGELNQKALPGALVVKAFNSVGHVHCYKPQFAGGPPDMFLCGDDAKAKEQVSRICKGSGWNPIDVGGIVLSHYLDAAAMIWIITAFTGGHWNQAFKLLRK